MFIAKKIITFKQMKTFRAKNSSVMKNFLVKGGEVIMRKKVKQREFWRALRADSKSHEFGERGYTKKGLTTFLGKLLNNKDDNFTSRRVKKFSDALGVKRNKLFNAAAEARVTQNKARSYQLASEKAGEHENKKIERQQTQFKKDEYQQKQAEIRNHISEIVSRGYEKAREDVGIPSNSLFNHGEIKHVDSYLGEEKKENSFQGDVFAKFEGSDSNIRKTEWNFLNSIANKPKENNSNAFGHLLYLKNKQHNFVSDDEDKKIKARLAGIQGKADNYDNDNQDKIAA